MTYAQRIRSILMANATVADPAWVEAWMRVEHGTLDALTPELFEVEVLVALECIAESPVEVSQQLAASYGLLAVSR